MKGRCDVADGEDSQRSFERAFDAHGPAILRYVLRRSDGNADASDAVSEAFVAAWRHWDRRPPREEEILAWLYRFAAHALTNQQRTTRRRVTLTVRAGRLSPRLTQPADDHGTFLPDVAGLMSAITTLSPTDQEVLMLLAWEELTDPHDLAAALGTSVSTARVRVHRARRRLRERLSSHDIDDSESSTTSWKSTVSLPVAEPRR